jgi:multisubunit Na+/H+ antiporter MnhB subunit
MQKRCKTAIVDLLGVIGIIIILVGLFTPIIDFWYGVLIAIIIWLLTGVIKKYWRIEPKKKK